jgi:hypothetical protein
MPLGETNGQAVLSEEEVVEIRQRYLSGDCSFVELARKYAVTKSNIQQILTGANWSWLLREGEAEALAQVRAERRTR